MEEIDKWKAYGYQILLMGYFNDYILIHRYLPFFAKLGLRELITEKNGEEVPVTTISIKRNNTIDGIWGSPVISTTRCGYRPVNYPIISDHRMTWVKSPSPLRYVKDPPIQIPLCIKVKTPSLLRSE